MINVGNRYARQIGLFGRDGQNRLAATHIALVGLGGLGSHFALQFAYLGVGRYTLIDGDTVSDHSLNRLVTALPNDVRQLKTDIAERLIRALVPRADVVNIPHHLAEIDAISALRDVDLILGGVDNDLARLQLTDIASSLATVYVDAATDIHSDSGDIVYGGRILTCGLTPGCLFCLDLLDQREIRHSQMTDAEKAAEAAIYGVPVEALNTQTGPSVVTINGVVAALAATEAAALITGLRTPVKHLVYRGDQGVVRSNTDQPARVCPYCSRWTQTNSVREL